MADSITIWKSEDCKEFLPIPKASDHKYRRGILGCITGSRQYPGAALLTTASALAVGIGMVRYLGPTSVKRQVIQNRPEVVIQNGKVDAYLIGSGVPENNSILRKLKMGLANRSDLPKVLDAGALYLSRKSKSPTIITPHSGELAKLLKVNVSAIEANPLEFAKQAAKLFNVTVLLKGSETLVTNGNKTIKLPKATSWLATAGTGDVLAGILGALLALNKSNVSHNNLIEIGATASFIHAEAAAISSNGPITPTEIINHIPEIISRLSK